MVDQFSSRAVEYNLQAEQATQQALLLNVVRASLRRPMQFTSVQAITGTASASGSINAGTTYQNQIPVVSQVANTVIGRILSGTGNATASLSGGPTFTVPVLDTQEFYQGILTPLSTQEIDYYTQQGFPRELLYDLFIQQVELVATDSPTCERFTFINSVQNELQFKQFQAFADYLLASGLTTERISDSTPYGPVITASHQPMNARDSAAMVDAMTKASTAGLDVQTDPKGYRLSKKGIKFRTCFALAGHQRPSWLGKVPDEIFCGHLRASRPAPARPVEARAARPATTAPACTPAQRGDESTAGSPGIKLSEALLTRLQDLHAEARYPEENFPVERFRNRHVTFRFQTRSVEGILYYLGEIVRQQLYPESGTARMIQFKNPFYLGSFPASECDSRANGGLREEKDDLLRLARRDTDPRKYSCENLFVLDPEVAPGAHLTVWYDGKLYAVPVDKARAGRTLQVLELVKQLLALHTSAKNLPQTTVISVIGGGAQ